MKKKPKPAHFNRDSQFAKPHKAKPENAPVKKALKPYRHHGVDVVSWLDNLD